jgi:hypothetical protein
VENMSIKKTALDNLSEVISKVAFDNFYSLNNDLLNFRKTEDVVFTISLGKTALGHSNKAATSISEKYKVDKEFTRNAINALSYLLRKLLSNDRQKVIDTLKEKEELKEKAESIVEIGEKLLREFPDIRQGYFLRTFCKTLCLGEIDWELSVKLVEPELYGFEKRDRFPVCTLRLFLDPQPAIKSMPHNEGRDVVFDISTEDVDTLIKTLTKIKEKYIEIEKELSTGLP